MTRLEPGLMRVPREARRAACVTGVAATAAAAGASCSNSTQFRVWFVEQKI